MALEVERVVAAYKQLAKIPALAGAKLSRSGQTVSSQWSVRNLDLKKRSKFAYTYTLDDKFNVIWESDFGTDVSNEILSAVSPSERFRAVIREHTEAKDTKKQYLEVWQSKTLEHSIDLNALDIHGDVYADSEFKTLNWSPDEKSIVYVAERKLPKSEPFIMRRKADEKKDKGEDPPVTQGEQYTYKQDWGEQLVGKHLSAIVVCHLEAEAFSVLKGLPESWCPGQVRWSPDGNSVVGVAWETEPRRLGLIFCTNRPSYIFLLTLDGQLRKISSEGLAVRSPRFNKSGHLVWLQRAAGGPHHAGHQIVSKAWPLQDESQASVVVDLVSTEVKTANGKLFYGVYSLGLPERLFAEDGKRLVFSTAQSTEERSYVVDIETKRIVDISDKNEGSTSVIDVKDDVILAFRSSLTRPHQLIIAKLPASGREHEINWQPVGSLAEVPISLQTAQVQYLELKQDGTDDEFKKFSAIYFAPTVEEGKKLPLVVWPHGGPHSSFINSFSLEAALFNMLGLATIQVNYRGSVGNGQASVNYLPSRCGSVDIADCKLAADEAVQRYPINPQQLGLFGGSHGGYLVTFLSGLYPESFAAVVTRNPVTDIASMFNSTDIADWCAVEAGFTFSEKGPVSNDILLRMREVSPIAHVHKVTAPTALMLGSVDKRVPYYQGLEFYRRLKANGCVAKLYVYEDNHSLSSLQVEMDNMINSLLWFKQHLKTTPNLE